MELKVWVDGIPRVVCGLSQETSCQDVVIALAQAIGQTGRYVLIQKLRDKERQLVANERPLESLAKLGQLGNEVQFILRRTGPTTNEASDKGRVPHLPVPPDPEPPKHKEPKKALTFNLGPSASSQTRAKKFEKTIRDSPRVSPSPPSSVASDAPSKEAVYQQILRQQAEMHGLQGQLTGVERELCVWERSPPPALSPDLLEEMDHLQQALRRNEAELAHLPYWEKEIDSEIQRENDMLKQRNDLSVAIDKESRRQHDAETLSEELKRDIQQLTDSKRNGMHDAKPSIEESVTIAKRQLDNLQRQTVELHTSNDETETCLRQADEQLLVKSIELDDLNKELRQCNLQQFIMQTGVTPAQINQQTEDMDFALLKPDGQSDEDSNSSILEFNPRTTAKQILGNPRSLQNPLVSSLHPEGVYV